MYRIVLFFLTLFFASCTARHVGDKPRVTVSIAPLAFLVESIADSTVDVQVMVPETTSPETYEPTARQVGDLSNSAIYFSIGLIDFEHSLSDKIKSIAPYTEYVELSEGLELFEGTCGHDHSAGDEHHHSVDPHIWLSPRYMKLLAGEVAKVLVVNFPNRRELYMNNLSKLEGTLDSLDSVLIERFVLGGAFAIVHPSLTYFARDYGLRQFPLEIDGKEPSAGQVKGLVDSLRVANVRHILYSRQSPDASARAVAGELGIDVVEYDPLRRDWLGNIDYLSKLLCN